MPAMKTCTLAAGQDEVPGSRLRDIVDEVREVEVIQSSSRIQNSRDPGNLIRVMLSKVGQTGRKSTLVDYGSVGREGSFLLNLGSSFGG